MEVWASRIPLAQFLCVSVDGKRVAQDFARMFRDTLNGYIPSRQYFPVGFGQLGCSGFIIVDKNGCFVNRRTKSFLDHGDAAFLHVQEILGILIGSENVATRAPKMKAPKSRLMTIQAPPSVGVSSMDNEHETCTAAINVLLNSPGSPDLLRTVLDELEQHFAHEECLMKKYSPPQAPSSFSPLSSHIDDHERILDMAREGLNAARFKPVS